MKDFLAAPAVIAGSFLIGMSSAHAASISVDIFSSADYDARATWIDPFAFQDFEDETEFDLSGSTPDTDGARGINLVDSGAASLTGADIGVGTVQSLGGTGTGGTVTGRGSFDGNDGSLLAVRDGDVFGRVSTTQFQSFGSRGDDQFLDSNDTLGIEWIVSAGGDMFDTVLFTLTDATDVGATLRITAGGETRELSNLLGSDNKRDGNQQTVQIIFGTKLSEATIELFNFTNAKPDGKLNDGFSLDDIVVGAQVPLPAAGWLLLGGVGGLAAMKRRRQS